MAESGKAKVEGAFRTFAYGQTSPREPGDASRAGTRSRVDRIGYSTSIGYKRSAGLANKGECESCKKWRCSPVLACLHAWRRRYRVLISSYETLRNYRALLPESVDLIVCDEAHRLKNNKAQTSASARRAGSVLHQDGECGCAAEAP